MKFYILASGSKGNSTLISDGTTNLLIDMGLTKKWLVESLSNTPFKFNDIQFVIFTHEHGDHISGADFFPTPIRYSTMGTLDVLPSNQLHHYTPIRIGSFVVTPLPVSHDANDPVGFLIESNNEKLVYMTDTGYISEKNLGYMKNADYYILEANHNVRMLLQTDRTFDLIQRILGDNGHLSNEDSAMYFSEMVGDKTKQIFLAHLSLEANSEEVALSTYVRILQKRYVDLDRISLKAARQYSLVCGGDLTK